MSTIKTSHLGGKFGHRIGGIGLGKGISRTPVMWFV